MTDYSWPLYRYTSTAINPIYVNKRSGSNAFTQQSYVNSASTVLWKASLTMSLLETDDARDLNGFIAKLKGGLNRVKLYDNARIIRGAQNTAACNVETAALPGTESITLKNLLVSTSEIFKADDLIGIGGNLYMITGEVSSDVNGKATVDIAPPLHDGIAVNDVVTLTKPTGLFMILSGFESGFDVNLHSPGRTYEFIEVPNV